VLDEKEKSELAKTLTDTVTVLLNSGIISPRTAGKEIKQASAFTDVGTNITDKNIEDLSDDVQNMDQMGQGLFGEQDDEPSLDPTSSPKKVLKEVGKKKEAGGGKGKAADSAERVAGMELYHAMPVTIEYSQGQVRRGKDWQVRMPADYGHIRGITGADGDELDCYVGPSPESSNVYVVDQKTLDGKLFDESKVMFGYHTQESALEDYMAGHSSSKKVFGAITVMTMPMFRRWTATADLGQPCSEELKP
jgi:hypothetical protein